MIYIALIVVSLGVLVAIIATNPRHQHDWYQYQHKMFYTQTVFYYKCWCGAVTYKVQNH